jgi:hypothetical protein
MRAISLTACLLAALASEAGAAVRHVPPAAATAAAPVELVADAPPSSPVLMVHYRTTGAPTFASAELVRQSDTRWVVVVPAAAVAAPGLEYYLTAGDTPVFASPAWPHTTLVNVSDVVERRGRDLLRTQSRRSRLHAAGEWVDYGTRSAGPVDLEDRYYRIDADFSYRLWAYPLEEIKVGYTRLLGDTEAEQFMCPGTDPCTADAGYKVAGWFELGLAPVEGLGIDARAMVLATQAGFNVGGRAEVRVGLRDATHVAAAVEHMADVGTSGQFRLGWATVPRTPMAAIVEITNLPASHRPAGVRFLYDLGRELEQGIRLGIRVGYTAREQQTRGFTTGANASIDF